MAENNRKELYSLSNQLIEVFITDVLSKNNVKMSEIKGKISAEQRDKLKETVTHLKDEVEDFLHTQDTRKTVTEKDQGNDQPAGPLREKVLNKKQTEPESEANEETDS